MTVSAQEAQETLSDKVEFQDASQLTPLWPGQLQPCRLLWSPVYLMLKKNQKLLCIKRRFDFFTDQELKKYDRLNSLLMGKDPDRLEAYQKSGERAFLQLVSEPTIEGLTCSSLDQAATVLLFLKLFWGKNLRRSYWQVVAWMEGFCGALGEDELSAVREYGREDYLKSLVRSSLTTFFSMHLGYVDRGHLRAVRARSMNLEYHSSRFIEHDELKELYFIVSQWLEHSSYEIDAMRFAKSGMKDFRDFRVFVKLKSRLEHLRRVKVPRRGV